MSNILYTTAAGDGGVDGVTSGTLSICKAAVKSPPSTYKH